MAHLLQPWRHGSGPPEAVLTPETLRATYGSEMLVLRQHGYTLIANSPLVSCGRHSDRPDWGAMEFLLELLTYAFFQRALLASLLVASVAWSACTSSCAA